jgi:hypothetical protein
MLLPFGLGLIALAAASATSQQNRPPERAGGPGPAASFAVTRAPGPIRVDGRLDDAGWQGAPEIPLDWEWTPGDNVRPPVRTTCRITYSPSNLYIGCQAADPDPPSIRARLVARDDTERLVLDDHLVVLIDPFNDQRRAFQFRVNPHGAQADAILSTAEGFEDFSWDAIWSSAGRLTDRGYDVEIAIPFRSLRFPRSAEPQTWGFLLERSWPRNLRHRMQSAPHDRNNQCQLCEANKVTGFQGISPGRNVELVPTSTASRTDLRPNFPSGPLEKGTVNGDLGLDVRWGVTPNLSLNGTLNPDFSQVEADVAQLDVNTRFALFFPEKRPFFLEGADFFQTPVAAVFTRTLADPDVGLKLTGKVGRSSRSAIGVFGARDALTNLLFPSNQGSGGTSLAQDAYTAVGRFRQDVGQASYVGALVTGRFGEGYANEVGGVDFFHQLTPSTSIRAQLLGSGTRYPDSVAAAFGQKASRFWGAAASAEVRHQTERWSARLGVSDLSPDFRADAGFVFRVDTRTLEAEIGPHFFRPWGWFTFLGLTAVYSQVHDHDGELSDRGVGGSIFYRGPLQSFVQLQAFSTEERFAGARFGFGRVRALGELKPAGWLGLRFYGQVGGAIDFAEAAEGSEVLLQPGAQVSIGRGLSLDLSHAYQRLDRDGGRAFTAHLFQSKVIYQFDVRTLVRAIVQYREVRRDSSLYSAPEIAARERGWLAQLLFSYKVNPQTVAFLGYAENGFGTDRFDLTRTDRTFFAKLGYAWRP